MTTNSVATGFSLRRSIEDQGVTLEDATQAHLEQAHSLYQSGKLKSFADYRVPNSKNPNSLV